MSKLIDNLNRLSRVSLAPMGFRAAVSQKSQPVLLVGLLSGTDKGLLGAVEESGLDGVIVKEGGERLGPQGLASVRKALDPLPWGIWWAKGPIGDASPLVESGVDFVVAPADVAPATVLAEKRLGTVLAIDASLADGLVAAIDALGVNAVFLQAGFEESSTLTIGNLLVCQRVARLLRKPFLVDISQELKGPDLQALVGVGVKGVVVSLPDKSAVGRVAEMKSLLGTLSAPKRESEVAVTRLAPEPRRHEGEEEES